MVNCNSSILCTRPADGAPKYYLQFFRPPIQRTVINFGGHVETIEVINIYAMIFHCL